MERDLEPIKQELQINHPCCKCGEELSAGESVMCVVVPIQIGNILTVQRIAWCDFCFGLLPGAFKSERPASNAAVCGDSREESSHR
jgi:hypothetical protein